jgi:hypothetical protein
MHTFVPNLSTKGALLSAVSGDVIVGCVVLCCDVLYCVVHCVMVPCRQVLKYLTYQGAGTVL